MVMHVDQRGTFDTCKIHSCEPGVVLRKNCDRQLLNLCLEDDAQTSYNTHQVHLASQ